MLEKIAVVLIVAGCAFFFVRRLIRQLRRSAAGCGCSCPGCDQTGAARNGRAVGPLPPAGNGCCGGRDQRGDE